MADDIEQKVVSIDELRAGVRLTGGHAVVLVVSGVPVTASDDAQAQTEEEQDGLEVSVVLLDDAYQQMPGAQWKADGAAPASGTAGGDALAVFKLASGAEKATLTWGGDAADQYSTTVWLSMPGERMAAARRRLDNLGFSAGPTLEDDIFSFQFEKDLEQTGSLDDIEQALTSAHGC